MTGRKQKRVEFFFAVQTACILRDLVEEELRHMKKEKIWLEIKQNTNEYTHSIGYLTGVIMEWVNAEWYEQTLSTLGNIRIEEFKLKKYQVCE